MSPISILIRVAAAGHRSTYMFKYVFLRRLVLHGVLSKLKYQNNASSD